MSLRVKKSKRLINYSSAYSFLRGRYRAKLQVNELPNEPKNTES